METPVYILLADCLKCASSADQQWRLHQLFGCAHTMRSEFHTAASCALTACLCKVFKCVILLLPIIQPHKNVKPASLLQYTLRCICYNDSKSSAVIRRVRVTLRAQSAPRLTFMSAEDAVTEAGCKLLAGVAANHLIVADSGGQVTPTWPRRGPWAVRCTSSPGPAPQPAAAGQGGQRAPPLHLRHLPASERSYSERHQLARETRSSNGGLTA